MNEARTQQSDVQARPPRRRPVALLSRAGFVAMALTLGACVAETPSVTLAPPAGASAERALDEFIITVVTVDLIDERCRSTGLRKTYGNTDRLIESYVLGLQKQGYSLPEIERAVDGLQVERMAVTALKRVEARGVEIGDDASLCRYGRKEIAAGSAIGKLLGAST
jgi:Family of unknown function (DUF5333)